MEEAGWVSEVGERGAERAIYDDEDVWDDHENLGFEERARVLQGREDERMIEEEGLRRAFEMQMRMVEELRREFEVVESRRLRVRQRENGSVADVDRQRRWRRRRRQPHEDMESGSVQRRRGRHDVPSGRMEDEVPESASEPASRARRGFRAFLNGAIDAADYVLFGSFSKRRD